MAGLAALSLAPRASAEVPPAVRELNLPAELNQDMEQRAQRVIQEARWLEELPLDGVAPGFVFTP